MAETDSTDRVSSVQRCQDCSWWRRRKARDLNAEFDADPRPTVRSFADCLRWLWNPNAFKSKPDDFDMDWVHDPNPTYGFCKRWPETTTKRDTDFCGEFLRASGEGASHGDV